MEEEKKEFKFDFQLFGDGDMPEPNNTEPTEQPVEDSSGSNDDYDMKIDADGNVIFDDHAFDDMMMYSPEEEDEPVQPAETPEEQTPQPQAQPQTYTVTVDGVQQQVTLDELQKGYMRQADYTRKTQELADQRRQLSQTQPPQYNAQTQQNPYPQGQPAQPTPEQEQQDTASYYQQLADYAKRNVEKRLGTEYDEYNPVHQVALADEVATIKAAVYERNVAQRNFKAVYDKYAQDKNIKEIDQFASQRLQQLPHREALKIEQALRDYDTKTIDAYMADCRDLYYRSRGYVPANEISKPKAAPQSNPVAQKPKPPYVESTGVRREEKEVKPSLDYSKLGRLTLEQQAQIASKFHLA